MAAPTRGLVPCSVKVPANRSNLKSVLMVSRGVARNVSSANADGTVAQSRCVSVNDSLAPVVEVRPKSELQCSPNESVPSSDGVLAERPGEVDVTADVVRAAVVLCDERIVRSADMLTAVVVVMR